MDAFASLRRQRYRDAGLIGFGLALLAAAMVLGGWAWRAERLVYDLGLALSARQASNDIVIVAIDDQSLAEIGIWPWRRAVHATLLAQLHAARPRAIFMDLLLSEPDSDPRQDLVLAQAIRTASPVILPVAWFEPPLASPRRLVPVAALRDAARLAQAEVALDSDGIMRHVFLRAGIGQADMPHAALALLEAGAEQPAASPQVEHAPSRSGTGVEAWVRDQRLSVRFQGPPGLLRRVSYVDVLRGLADPQLLRGKYVLIGMTAVGMGDAHATPMGGGTGPMPGIEVIGQTLQSLRNGDTLTTPPLVLTATLSAFAVLALVMAFAGVRQRYALGLALLCVAVAALASVALIRFGWWITPLGFIPAALLAYPLWSWRRLEVNARVLDDEIARLGVDDLGPSAPSGTNMTMYMERRWSVFHDAAESLRRARRFLAASLDGLSEAVLIANIDGEVVLANRRAATMFEVDGPDELAGLSLPRLLGESTSAQEIDWASQLRAVAERKAAMSVQVQFAGRGDFLVSATPAPDADGPRLIVTCADVSSIKAAQRQREEALAFVTHDLRSPLASIALLADLHGRGIRPLTPEATMREVHHLAGRALSLSEAFVRAAQAESKPLDLALGDFHGLLQAVLRGIQPQAHARAITLRYESTLAAPAMARFDHELLHRAVENLLSNAIKFSSAGGAVALGLTTQAGGHLITVRDQGPGMNAQQLASVFGTYARAGVDPARAGVGLGLQFVQRVAERHGGSIRAESAPGLGACFELRIPAH